MKRKLSDFYYNISMKMKWVIFICGIILYQIILIGYVGYKNYEDVLGQYFIEGVQKDIGNVTEQVGGALKSIEEFAKELQYDEYINSFIQEKEYSGKVSGMNGENQYYRTLPDYEFKRATEKHLNSIVLSRPEIQLASIQYIAEPDRSYTVTRSKSYAEELSFREMDIYSNELEEDVITLYHIDDDKELYIIQELKSRTTLRHAATLIFKIDSKVVFEKVENMIESAKKGVYVIGFDNKEILTAGEVSDVHKQEVLNNYKENSLPGIYPGEHPKKEIIVYDTIETTSQELGVAVLIFKDILFSDIRASSLRIITFSLLTMPLFLLLAYKLYKDLLQPIYDLSGKMGRIEKGEMGVLVDNGRKDEIGVLFRSFNRMSNRINFLVNRVYKEQLALKNSEIRALQAQINPHFLYNTLEIINWTARLSGADEVAEMIEALGGIMEINIDRKNERLLTVEEELKYTNHYIFLIKKRFGDKIKFEKYIDQAVMAHKVPRLILQPIIENAIEHGVEPVGQGLVEIRVFQKEAMLVIEIEDSGQGIKEDMLTQIQYNLANWDQLASEKVESTSKGKIGVLNVHSRLRLIYGDQSGIEIISIYEEGTLVRMKIPIEENHA